MLTRSILIAEVLAPAVAARAPLPAGAAIQVRLDEFVMLEHPR